MTRTVASSAAYRDCVMTIASTLASGIAAFLVSWLLTGLILRVAIRFSILDHPNSRSSHSVPTPRGGGLGIVIVVVGAIAGLYLFGQMPADVFASLVVGGILIAGIGAVDDYRHVPAQWRFLVQIIAASFAVAMLGGLPNLQIGRQFVDLGLVGDVAAIIFTVWFINLYNFMDGIDGIAAIEAICIAGGAVIVLLVGGNSGFSTIMLIVFVAAVLGFLFWNWPPARIFMGDVGSGFIGLVLALFAVITVKQGLLPIWCWLILAGVFVVDSTITLIIRVVSGEQWYSAHKNHAYQKASRRLGGHKPVTLVVLAIDLFWLLPIAFVATAQPESGWWLTLAAWIPLVLLVLLLKAGRPDLAA